MNERYIISVVDNILLLFIYFISSNAFRLQICLHTKVSHNILTNHTFDFHNSTILAFIPDR